MAQVSDFDVKKLKGSENYHYWKFSMENYLALKKLDKCIKPKPGQPAESSETCAQKLIEAKSILSLSVADPVIVHIQNARSALEIWNILQDLHEDKGLLHKTGLLRALMSVRLDEVQSMKTYVEEIANISNRLNGIGFNIGDEWLASILLAGLNEEYKPFIMNIERSGEQITADMIKQKLLNTQVTAYSSEARRDMQDVMPADGCRQRKNYIDIRLHYLREKVENGIVAINYIPTNEMAANNLTKKMGAVAELSTLSNNLVDTEVSANGDDQVFADEDYKVSANEDYQVSAEEDDKVGPGGISSYALVELALDYQAPFTKRAFDRLHGGLFGTKRAVRSTDVVLFNKSKRSFLLFKSTCAYGLFTTALLPEYEIRSGTSSVFGVESRGVSSGVECTIIYITSDCQFVQLTSNNPYVGIHSISLSNSPPFKVTSVIGKGENNQVHWIIADN